MAAISGRKYMTEGEAGLSLFLAVGAFLCAIASARAVDAPFGIHMALFALAGRDGVTVRSGNTGVHPAILKELAAKQALDLLREPLLDVFIEDYLSLYGIHDDHLAGCETSLFLDLIIREETGTHFGTE